MTHWFEKKRLIGALLVLTLLVPVGIATAGEKAPEIEIITTTEAYDPIRYEAAFLIADSWKKLGIDVNVRPMEFSTILQRFYNEQDFDAVILGWSGRVERLDPQHFLGTLHSGQSTLGGNNPGGYNNPEYDALFEGQQAEFDIQKRRELVHKAQEIAAGDQPVDILFYRDEVVAYNSSRFENPVAMAGEGFYNEWTPYSVKPLGDKKILTIGTQQEPDTINPLASTSVWGWKFMRMVYDKLVRLSPDIEPLPSAAESFHDVDEKTVEIVLRKGMKFHDGKPVTVEDVKFSYDYFIAKDFAYFRPFLGLVGSTEVVNEDRVRFNLKTPFAPFITVTLAQIPILPKHLWEKIDEPDQLAPEAIPVVGSGPFAFDRYERGQYKRILKFAHHYMADEMEIEGIDYMIYADAEGVLTGLLTGQIDMTAWRLEPGQIPLAEQNPDVTVVAVPDFGYYHHTYNLRRTPFDDRNFRRAIAHAADKETIINVLLSGRGEPGNSVIAPVNGFWHNPDIEIFDFDLDKSRAILKEAGYTWDAAGKLHLPKK
jgi:peptide/nickel transport system substrate-binding protein